MTGLVLCGGRSSRMGRDKALLEVGGRTMLQLQIERLEQAGCGEVLISGPKGRGYESCGKRIVEDEVGGAGPLAGLCAGLRVARDSHMLALAVDLPDVTADFLRSLSAGPAPGAGRVTPRGALELAASHVWDAVVPASKNRFEPLCAVYRREVCLPIMEQRLRDGNLALQGMVEALVRNVEVRIVGEEEWRAWGETLLRNWNDGVTPPQG